MKQIKLVHAVVLFIAALCTFAIPRVFGTSPDSPGRHEQPPQDNAPTTVPDIHGLGCLEIQAPAIEVEAFVMIRDVDQGLAVTPAIPVPELPPQRRFGERARWFPKCGWEYGWQRFGT